ncbi:GNAT family acetyltransferase YjcF [Umbelopsis sp. PMI_123]|nr:GNAT family acetyltransferase YjcF [Umbelopsis sp. PMI_123]
MSTIYSVIRAETPEQIQECYNVRIKVFVHEQQIPLELEIDEYDPKCLHWLASALDTSQEQSRLPLGTIRLYRLPNTSIGKLGRLAVDLSARGLGLGRKLVETMEEDAKQSGITFIDVHSQVDKRTFYEKLGYHVVDDEVFVEDGIDHIKMGKSLI